MRIIAGVLGTLGLVLAIQKGAKSTLIATFAAADVFLICSVAIEYMLFYKMWAAIKDSQTSISPGKAVGFLFIPVFNLYWALLMVTGFAEDYNSFILQAFDKGQRIANVTVSDLRVRAYAVRDSHYCSYAMCFRFSAIHKQGL